ncbi:MAG TPA: hypothetical protein VFQ53_33060 [Kofleriaceae bacterium]|nr:hypothetical protein [Kofleriaceae bacterium]
MSRLLIVAALVSSLTSLSSLASADRIASPNAAPRAPSTHQFAQPPNAAAELPQPDIAPYRVLDRATVRAQLLANRSANLARFRAYQKKGVFPSNTFADRKLNVWLDEFGHLCAAATIIKMSGNEDLVARVAEQSNFIRLADVRQGPLMDWILTSGLTQEEIAAIQEPFMPVTDEPRIQPKPEEPVINVAKRKAEDARLLARYRTVDAMIVKNQKRSLDTAVDRLMEHPTLAWQLIDNAARAD